LSEELGRARADAAAQQARAQALESRMSRLENAALSASGRAEERALLNRLDRMLDLNERLLAERAASANVAPSSNDPQSATSAPSASPASASAESPLSEEEQLRELVVRMRGRAGRPHDGLTREQEAALRVLTQPERKLDTENLWPAAFY